MFCGKKVNDASANHRAPVMIITTSHSYVIIITPEPTARWFYGSHIKENVRSIRIIRHGEAVGDREFTDPLFYTLLSHH